MSFDSAGPALGFSSHHGDLNAIHQDVHFRDGLFGNNGQDELFGALDLALVSEGDFRANALRRPFDGFGGDFQTCQHLHRFAGWCERHLGANHCFHASDTGGRFQTGNTQFFIDGMLSFQAIRAVIIGTQNLDRTDYRKKGFAAHFLEACRVTTRTGRFQMIGIRRFELQQLRQGRSSGLMHGGPDGGLDALQIESPCRLAVAENDPQ